MSREQDTAQGISGEGDDNRKHDNCVSLPSSPSLGETDSSLSPEEEGLPSEVSADPDSAELLRAFYAGADHNFDVFWARYFRTVLRIAWRILASEADAQDVAQIVAFTICRRCSPYDPTKGVVEAWVYTLTVRAAQTFSRTNRRRHERERAFVQESARLHDGNAEVATDESEKTAAFLDCLETLPPTQREIIGLIEVGDYKQREVAQMLDVTEAAVSQALNRARIKLRACLRSKGWLPPLKPQTPKGDNHGHDRKG